MDNYTRDYYRGRSFNFAGEWTIDMHYYNDEYNTDFVTYKGALLACKNSHFSERGYEPSLVYGDSDNPKIPTGVNSKYWLFVTGGTPGPKGEVLVPKYNEATGLLSWSLVDGDDVEVPEGSYIKGKDGITPKLRVNSLGYWEVSYDNGTSYTNTGAKAQGEKGDPFTYEDLTSSQKAELQKPATEAAQKVDNLTNKAELLLENLKGAAADATRAAGKAESAANSVDKAVANANAALATANSATEKAENATNKVNSAIKSIDTAVEKANNATSAANSAASNAEQWSHDVREAIGKCIMATDKADTAARKVFALLGLIDSSKKDVDAALKDANEALANAKEAEKTLDSIISNAKEATKEANEATAQLKDALKNVDDAVKSAEDFIESATKQIEDLKNSTEETIKELTEKAKKKFRKFVEEATEVINNLKEETEAALQEAQAKLEEISTKIENFVAEQTEELHRLYGDVEEAISGANKATNAANEATIETLKHLAECREQCELTKTERKRASAAADRAEASAKACEDFIAENQPKIDEALNIVDTLVGEDTGKSVRTITVEEITRQLIPENAKESLDTLQEIADWIQKHPDDASAMNTAIKELEAKMAAGEEIINNEITRSTEKDNELDSKIESLNSTLQEVISQGTEMQTKEQNIIDTLGMKEDGTFDLEKFKTTNYLSGDDINREHIESVAQALIQLDFELHKTSEVAYNINESISEETKAREEAITKLETEKANRSEVYSKEEADNKFLTEHQDLSELKETVAKLNGNYAVDGSVSNALKQAKDYTDDKVSSKVSKVELKPSTGNDLVYNLWVDDRLIEGSTINIPKDQFLKDVVYNPETKQIRFTFETESGEKVTDVSVSDLVDTYEAGAGLKLEGNKFTVAISDGSEGFLQVDESGIRTNGLTAALDLKANVSDLENFASKNQVEENTAVISSVKAVTDNNALEISQLKKDVASLEPKVESSDSVKLTLSKQTDGTTISSEVKLDLEKQNIIKVSGNGIYAEVSLEYNSAENKLTFTAGGVSQDIQLAGANIIKEGHYDNNTHEIVLTLTEGDQIRVPVSDLFNQLKAINPDNDPVNLVINHNADGQDTIQANLNISSSPDNLILAENGTLFASKQAKDHYMAYGGQEIVDVQTAVNRVKELAESTQGVAGDLDDLKTEVKSNSEAITSLQEEIKSQYINKDASNMTLPQVESFKENLGINKDINSALEDFYTEITPAEIEKLFNN